MKVQYPAPLNNFEARFWRYSVKDLARIGVPTLGGWFAGSLPGAVVGAAAGIGLAEAKPYGKTVDQLAVDYVGSKAGSVPLREIEENHGDGVVILDDGTVVGIVKVDSVDLKMASDAEWRMNRDTLGSLYKKLDYPIEIHSRKNQIDLTEYSGSPDQAVTTDHFVVTRKSPGRESRAPWKDVRSESVEERVETVADRCKEIRESLTAGDLYAEILDQEELEKIAERFHHDSIEADDKPYRQLLYVAKYPEQHREGLLSDVLNADVPGYVDVVQSVKPITEKEWRKLGRLVGRLKVESVATPDPIRGSEIDRMVRDAEDMIEVVSTGEEQLVRHAVYFVVRGGSKEEAYESAEELKQLLRQHQIEYQKPRFQINQVIQTESPFYEDRLDQGLLMPTRSAAGSFAFSTHDKFEYGGVVFGTDTRNSSPVILNRFQWDAGHIARMGKTGSGKTYAEKLTLLRSVQQSDELKVRILDPKPEYRPLGRTVRGKKVTLEDTDLDNIDVTNDFARFRLKENDKDQTELLVDAARYIYNEVTQDDRKTIVVVDEAHRLLKDADGRAVLGELVREGRSQNVSVELITQNASDFTRSVEGRNMLKNMSCYIFMRHQDVRTDVSEFFNLSQKESEQLRRLRTGKDLPFSEAVIRGPVNTKLRIQASGDEEEKIGEADG